MGNHACPLSEGFGTRSDDCWRPHWSPTGQPPEPLHLRLLRDLQCIVNFDAEIADSTLELRRPSPKLSSTVAEILSTLGDLPYEATSRVRPTPPEKMSAMMRAIWSAELSAANVGSWPTCGRAPAAPELCALQAHRNRRITWRRRYRPRRRSHRPIRSCHAVQWEERGSGRRRRQRTAIQPTARAAPRYARKHS